MYFDARNQYTLHHRKSHTNPRPWVCVTFAMMNLARTGLAGNFPTIKNCFVWWTHRESDPGLGNANAV